MHLTRCVLWHVVCLFFLCFFVISVFEAVIFANKNVYIAGITSRPVRHLSSLWVEWFAYWQSTSFAHPPVVQLPPDPMGTTVRREPGFSSGRDSFERDILGHTPSQGGSVAEWLACWTQAQKGLGSNRSRDVSGNSLRQTVHTHRASVHPAAKLVAALLRVAGVTAGLAESNGSLPPGLWLTLHAGWLPRTGISSGTLRSVIEYGLPLPFYNLLSVRANRVQSLNGIFRFAPHFNFTVRVSCVVLFVKQTISTTTAKIYAVISLYNDTVPWIRIFRYIASLQYTRIMCRFCNNLLFLFRILSLA